jgi:hypothetical protein
MTGNSESTVDRRGRVSRRGFVALAGGSVGAAALLAACGGSDPGGEAAQFGDGDIGVLNYLLTLEHLETALYADIVKSGLFEGSQLATMRKFGEEEEEHAAALAKAAKRLGGDPAGEVKASFELESVGSALSRAEEIENLSAAAYLGQLTNVEHESALATVLSIHTVEGRHAATIATMLGKPITPDGAFAAPSTVKAVLRSAEPFIASELP